MKLERALPATGDPNAPSDDEADLRNWADLRDFQMQFARVGGLQGMG